MQWLHTIWTLWSVGPQQSKKHPRGAPDGPVALSRPEMRGVMDVSQTENSTANVWLKSQSLQTSVHPGKCVQSLMMITCVYCALSMKGIAQLLIQYKMTVAGAKIKELSGSAHKD